MKFDQREWVNDIAVGTLTGMIGGVVMAMLVPEPPLADAVVAGGLVGLSTGLDYIVECFADRALPDGAPPAQGTAPGVPPAQGATPGAAPPATAPPAQQGAAPAPGVPPAQGATPGTGTVPR